jgi:hypothetical protein
MSILYDEITNDPLARGYAGMTNEEVSNDLNTVYRTRNRASMSGDEIYQQTVPAEFLALTADNKQLWMAFCGRDSINPFATANVQTVVQIFGSVSTTVANLNASRVESVSRAVELGLGFVLPGEVDTARTYGG